MTGFVRSALALAAVVSASCGPSGYLSAASPPAEESSLNVPGADAGMVGPGGYGGAGGGVSSSGAAGAGGSGASGAGPGAGGAGLADGGPRAGTLTAGVWDDNLNFARFTAYRDGLANLAGLPAYSGPEQEAAQLASLARAPKTSLDVAMVIDTTGSMGDEIAYLQAEFLGISSALASLHPGVPQRWALVDYRDTGDAWVVKSADFGSDLVRFQALLNGLAAGGGGDFPEAPEQALERAGQLSWSADPAAARLVFWVADAPHHPENAGALVSAVRALQQRSVHVYPVASSGVDELTEYSMRAAAQLTLGRYLFLTNDSGVGGTHKEPSIACYWVTRLAHAIERAVASEIAGSTVEIDPAQVLRSSGEPQNGQCALPSGQAVVF